MLKNQKSNWMEILKKDKNFKMESFNNLLIKNENHEERTLIMYRNILIRQSNNKDFNLNRENIERMFIEPISKLEYKKILKSMQINNWSLKELYIEAKKSGCCILNIVNCRKVMAA